MSAEAAEKRTRVASELAELPLGEWCARYRVPESFMERATSGDEWGAWAASDDAWEAWAASDDGGDSVNGAP